MSNKTLIIIVVLIIAGLGLGLLVGIYLGGTLYQQEENKPLKNAIDPLKCLGSSKIISAVGVIGEVTKISGRTVTLYNGTENFPVTINENAKILSWLPQDQGEKSFEAIKVGDSLLVNVKVLSDGQFEVSGVTINSRK